MKTSGTREDFFKSCLIINLFDGCSPKTIHVIYGSWLNFSSFCIQRIVPFL